MKYVAQLFTFTYTVFASLAINAQEDSVSLNEYIQGLTDSHSIGYEEAFLATAFIVGVMSLAAFGVYKILREQIHKSIVEEVREGDCIGRLSLGYTYFQAAVEPGLPQGQKKIFLSSAIAVTRHAIKGCDSLREDNSRKRPTKALLSSNLAYYLIELAEIDAKKRKKYVGQALNALQDGAIDIMAMENTRHLKHCNWYNVLESSLWVKIKSDPSDQLKANIILKIKELTTSIHVPQGWQEETKETWKDYLEG